MFSVDIEEFQGICCCLLLVFQARLLDTIGTTRGFGDHDLKVAFCGLPIKPFLTPQPEVCLFVCLFVFFCKGCNLSTPLRATPFVTQITVAVTV